MSLQEEDPDDAPLLRTPRLTLRVPRLADAPALVRLADNPRIAVQTARMPHPYRKSDAVQWITRELEPGDARRGRSFVIVDGGPDDAVVGAAGFGKLDLEDFEVGYWVGEPYWGRGIATEALQSVIDHAFATAAQSRLFGRCRVGNPASRRVLEKCGFQYQSAGMCPSRTLKGPVPSEDFVLERSVWQSLKHWAAR